MERLGTDNDCARLDSVRRRDGRLPRRQSQPAMSARTTPGQGPTIRSRRWSTRGNNLENGQKRIILHVADALFLGHNGVNRSNTSFGHPPLWRNQQTERQRHAYIPLPVFGTARAGFSCHGGDRHSSGQHRGGAGDSIASRTVLHRTRVQLDPARGGFHDTDTVRTRDRVPTDPDAWVRRTVLQSSGFQTGRRHPDAASRKKGKNR